MKKLLGAWVLGLGLVTITALTVLTGCSDEPNHDFRDDHRNDRHYKAPAEQPASQEEAEQKSNAS